jgi:hypothetical protein
MTTGISLVRENVISMKPPRSLWVTFSLGRPLGVPNDPAFQHRVTAAALDLLNRDQGPVLEDFPEDAPAASHKTAPVCPVTFPVVTDESTWRGQLRSELSCLKPWYELGLRRRNGRTLVGVSDLPVIENINKLGDYLDTEKLPTTELHWFKHAIEDAKMYYLEALTGQPGDYNENKIHQILWHETRLGAGLTHFYRKFNADPKLHPFARIVIPREAIDSTTDDETE